MTEKIDDKIMEEAGKASLAQDDQMKKASKRLVEQAEGIKSLKNINDKNSSDLDFLLLQAKNMLEGKEVDSSAFDTNKEKINYNIPEFEPLDIIDTSDDWNTYKENVEIYAKQNGVDLTKDPYEELLTKQEKETIAKSVKEDYTMKEAHCDKYDYFIAAICGVVSGLIDSFFVGIPSDSKLKSWTDKETDNIVIKFANLVTKEEFKDGTKIINGEEKEVKAVAFAIEALEKTFGVHYDQATGSAAGSVFNMTLSNHHMKSLSHSPSVVGLLFSILDQIQGTSHFVDNGRLITYKVPAEKIIPLQGNNLIENIFYGGVNWFGHIMSDIAGSSTTRSKDSERRGMGVPIPGFELLQFIGKKYDSDKDIKEQKKSVADFSVEMFEKNNYDFRFGVAQSIPVAINELLIRFSWGIKQRYYHDKPWKDCIPVGSQPELRRMLLSGHGVLCLVDVGDAGIRAFAEGGNLMSFALRTNFVAWQRLALSGLLEVRAIYSENAIDIAALDSDLEREWNVLAH